MNFSKKYNANTDVVIKTISTGVDVKKGWITISLNKKSAMIYIARDNNRIYWIGRKTGKSAKLIITFSDRTHSIKINNSSKISFNKKNHYDILKQKAIYYGLLNKNKIIFE